MPANDSASGDINADGLPETVLIVEDDDLVATNTRLTLLDLGVRKVEIACTVAEAMQAIDEAGFDLVVIDLVLGAESGLTVAERCFADNIPIIFATGYGNLSLPKQYGGSLLLRKPYTIEQMERALERRH